MLFDDDLFRKKKKMCTRRTITINDSKTVFCTRADIVQFLCAETRNYILCSCKSTRYRTIRTCGDGKRADSLLSYPNKTTSCYSRFPELQVHISSFAGHTLSITYFIHRARAPYRSPFQDFTISTSYYCVCSYFVFVLG
jgi:hypothetical protein